MDKLREIHLAKPMMELSSDHIPGVHHLPRGQRHGAFSNEEAQVSPIRITLSEAASSHAKILSISARISGVRPDHEWYCFTNGSGTPYSVLRNEKKCGA
jgi:hypothetical protein